MKLEFLCFTLSLGECESSLDGYLQLLVTVKSSIGLLFGLIPLVCFVRKAGRQQQKFVIIVEVGQLSLSLEQVHELVHILIKRALEKLFAFQWNPCCLQRGGGEGESESVA